MTKDNLQQFFDATRLDISSLKPYNKLLAIQIIYLYFIIKDWYIKDKISSVSLFKYLLENADNIVNTCNIMDACDAYLHHGYIALLERQSPLLSNLKDTDAIKYLNSNDKFYYAIYIATNNTYHIIFNFHLTNIILLIDVNTQHIKEYKSIEECLHDYNITHGYDYEYQLLRLYRRYYVDI